MKAIIAACKIILLFLLPFSGFGQEERSDWFLLPSSGSGERQIPDWFLHPEPGEYVGVSLPSFALERSALFSALLSYCAREEMEVRREESIACRKDKGESLISRMGGLGLNHHIGILEVSRKFLNEYNELFVAVKIGKDDSTSFSLQSFWRNDSIIVDGRLKQFESESECTGVYFDRMADKFIGCEYAGKNGDCHIVMQDAFTKEVFDSNSHYTYRNKRTATQAGKSRKQFSCKQSLGFAYLQGMWTLLEGQKEVEKVEKEQSDGSNEILEYDVMDSVILKKLDYSMSVENNNLVFTVY